MFLYFIVGVIAGIIGANMAKSRDQNPALWFVVCSIFPIAVFGLLFIEEKADEFKNTSSETKINEDEFKNTSSETKINEDEDKFSVSFQTKNEDSWSNIKVKLLKFYKQYNIEDIISDKEKSWMIGSSEIPGYIEAKLDNDIITIVSFKLPKPDVSIIESETKKKETHKTNSQSSESDITVKLIELANMLEKGLLSKEEFEKMKKDLIK